MTLCKLYIIRGNCQLQFCYSYITKETVYTLKDFYKVKKDFPSFFFWKVVVEDNALNRCPTSMRLSGQWETRHNHQNIWFMSPENDKLDLGFILTDFFLWKPCKQTPNVERIVCLPKVLKHTSYYTSTLCTTRENQQLVMYCKIKCTKANKYSIHLNP